MSDVTDMMLDGTLCQICEVIMPDMSPTEKQLRDAPKSKEGIPLIDIPAVGHPRTCKQCKRG